MAKKKGKKMSAGLKAFLKRNGRFPRKGELGKAQASPGRGHKTSHRSGGSKPSGGRSMAKREPLPIIGVRGSETAISAPKAILLGAAATLVASTVPGEGESPGERLFDRNQGVGAAINGLKRAAAYSWSQGHGKIVAAGLGAIALFGKAVDRRFRGFPIKFGR